MNSEERRKAISEVNQQRTNKSRKTRNPKVRKVISQANKQRVNKSQKSWRLEVSHKEPINYKLLISLFLPLLLLVAYASIWLYEFGYFSYFGISPDEIELNLYMGIAPSIILIVAAFTIMLFLSLIIQEVLILFSVYFISFFILIAKLLSYKTLSQELLIYSFICFNIIFIIIVVILRILFNRILDYNKFTELINHKLKNYSWIVYIIPLIFFLIVVSGLSWMFWYFILNMHYNISPSMVNSSIAALLLILFLVITLIIVGISNLFINQIQNKKIILWFALALPVFFLLILFSLLWGQREAKNSLSIVSIRLVDMPKTSSTSYVLVRHYPDKLILKDALAQLKEIKKNAASQSEVIIDKIDTAIIGAPTVIIQGTENVLIKDISFPSASPSTGQQ